MDEAQDLSLAWKINTEQNESTKSLLPGRGEELAVEFDPSLCTGEYEEDDMLQRTARDL